MFQSEALFSFTNEQLMFSASLNSLIHSEHSGIVIIQCGLLLLGVQVRSKKYVLDSRTVMKCSAILDFLKNLFLQTSPGFYTQHHQKKSSTILWTAITGSFKNMVFT